MSGEKVEFMAKKQKAKQGNVAWTAPDKPNVEFDDPTKKPNAEDLAGRPVDRAILAGRVWAAF